MHYSFILHLASICEYWKWASHKCFILFAKKWPKWFNNNPDSFRRTGRPWVRSIHWKQGTTEVDQRRVVHEAMSSPFCHPKKLHSWALLPFNRATTSSQDDFGSNRDSVYQLIATKAVPRVNMWNTYILWRSMEYHLGVGKKALFFQKGTIFQISSASFP